ncbi:N-formylglutamate amidohydrolase [Ornithinimicrobium sp. Y1694]|uniref:N-formylglutamate amidohydrolase n=1 Tax=Ornithinimicrobium sp. Y1694 TaxID=3418590 RepID=UPI003CEF0D4E
MSTAPSHALFEGDWTGQLVATAIHNGHELRPEVAEAMVLPEDVRRREEDPYTDVIGADAPARVVARRSRFEVDLNRPRDTAVYRTPADCWDLDVWRDTNMSAGGKAEAVEVTDEMLELVDSVRPKLVADGMFLVGLDIVGDKLMEVNVFSPGGLGSCQGLYDVDFAPAVIADLEHKVAMRAHYGRQLPNASLATL